MLVVQLNSCDSFFNFRKANFPLLYILIGEIDWGPPSLIGDVEDACEFLFYKLYKVL